MDELAVCTQPAAMDFVRSLLLVGLGVTLVALGVEYTQEMLKPSPKTQAPEPTCPLHKVPRDKCRSSHDADDSPGQEPPTDDSGSGA